MGIVNVATIAGIISDSIAVKQKVLGDQQLLSQIEKVTLLCIDAFKRGNKVLIAGNGGSAADAQHMAAEFVARFEFDRPGLPCIALTTDTSSLTAISNDYGYERLFSRQIEALGRKGDVFIGITTSGNSKNILKAMEVCSELGVKRVAMCGTGGKVQEMTELVLSVPSTHTPRIQESHGLIAHIICGLCEAALFSEFSARGKS